MIGLFAGTYVKENFQARKLRSETLNNQNCFHAALKVEIPRRN